MGTWWRSSYTIFGLIGGVPRRAVERASGRVSARRFQRRRADLRLTRRVARLADVGRILAASADIAASEIIILHGSRRLFQRHRRRRRRRWDPSRGRVGSIARGRRPRRHRVSSRSSRSAPSSSWSLSPSLSSSSSSSRSPRGRSYRRHPRGRWGGGARLVFVLFVRARERVQHGTQHLGGPLGEGGVTRGGRLIA